jgi:hypothetical protein
MGVSPGLSVWCGMTSNTGVCVDVAAARMVSNTNQCERCHEMCSAAPWCEPVMAHITDHMTHSHYWPRHCLSLLFFSSLISLPFMHTDCHIMLLLFTLAASLSESFPEWSCHPSCDWLTLFFELLNKSCPTNP